LNLRLYCTSPPPRERENLIPAIDLGDFLHTLCTGLSTPEHARAGALPACAARTLGRHFSCGVKVAENAYAG
jgi:hypothetical protein